MTSGISAPHNRPVAAPLSINLKILDDELHPNPMNTLHFKRSRRLSAQSIANNGIASDELPMISPFLTNAKSHQNQADSTQIRFQSGRF